MRIREVGLEDRASFRRFCGFSATETTPERTAFVRFRAELVRRSLDRVLIEAVTRRECPTSGGLGRKRYDRSGLCRLGDRG